jgi:hypothetical protein
METELSCIWGVWLCMCACLCAGGGALEVGMVVCIWVAVWVAVWVAWEVLHSRPQPTPAPTPLREERFMRDPMAPKRPVGGEYGWISPFIKEVRKYLNLTRDQSPSQHSTIVSMIVEKAALGIIEEGKLLGELPAAEKMAELLMAQQNQGINEIWKCCARLYTMESFLYKKLNESMREIGSEEHEHMWRSKIGTLGPFCFLLWDCPFENKLTKKIDLYRGAQLTPEQIKTYQNMRDLPHEYRSFQAFTSCSRNCSRAELFGNVLFIMHIQRAFTVDLTQISESPHEEEELIIPGVCFKVRKMEFDKDKDKHVVYLELNQRFNRKYDQFFHSPCDMIRIFLKILI